MWDGRTVRAAPHLQALALSRDHLRLLSLATSRRQVRGYTRATAYECRRRTLRASIFSSTPRARVFNFENVFIRCWSSKKRLISRECQQKDLMQSYTPQVTSALLSFSSSCAILQAECEHAANSSLDLHKPSACW